MGDAATPCRIGVLALQGAFREHITSLQKLPGIEAVEVRTKEELHACDGLIIPGGESTTMALVAQRWGLIPELQSYAWSNRPIWGTCAGLIFLAERATNQKQGGQALLGGLDVQVARNFFGSQINSFETWLPAPKCLPQDGPSSGTPAANTDVFRALFIRAPAITEAGPEVEVLATYTLSPAELAENPGQPSSVIVAVRSGALLATSFHPELVDDVRWHALFVKMVREGLKGSSPAKAWVKSDIAFASRKPRDLPKH